MLGISGRDTFHISDSEKVNERLTPGISNKSWKDDGITLHLESKQVLKWVRCLGTG